MSNFKKANGNEDLLVVQAVWERALTKYEDTPNAQKLTEDILISAYMNILPDKLADNLRNLDTEFDTLKEVKAYARKQVNAHANPVAEVKPIPMELGNVDKEDDPYQCGVCGIFGANASPSSGTSFNSSQEEIGQSNEHFTDNSDYYNQLASMVKGGHKGGGKGWKGSGGFNGSCFFCHEPGHSKKNCPKLDRVMETLRAKGIGKGGPKGGKHGGWGGQNMGWHGQWGTWGTQKGDWKGQGPKGWGHDQWTKGKGKGKGEWQGKGGGGMWAGHGLHGLYGIDALDFNQQSNTVESSQQYLPAFSLLEEEETPGPGDSERKGASAWSVPVKNSFEALATDDDEESTETASEEETKVYRIRQIENLKKKRMPRMPKEGISQAEKKRAMTNDIRQKQSENDIRQSASRQNDIRQERVENDIRQKLSDVNASSNNPPVHV